MGDNKSYLSGLKVTIAVTILLLGTTSDRRLFLAGALAQTNKPSPLEITTPDPLLPQPPVNRDLSSPERYRLEQALNALNAEAAAELQAGNDDKAFEIWYRELRLRRVLGRLEEVQALGRVGEIAWGKTRKADVQIITKRLEAIQQEAQTQSQLNPELLRGLGQAYEKIRVPGQAIEIYQQILANAREKGDIDAQKRILETLGQLHLAWFDYPKASATYEELLNLARSQSNYVSETQSLQQLAYIYDQASQPKNAVKAKLQLAESYLEKQQLTQLAALKISLAADYQALNQPEEASENYQQAFEIAWSQKQFGVASEALEKLGDLYREYDQLDYALQIYQELVKAEQLSYDYYGLMNTYDRMGKIYLAQKNHAKALEVLQKGLEVAESLKYQEAYFRTQIAQVNEQLNSEN